MRTKVALLFVSLISGWAFADIAVTPGTGKTVKTDTVGGAEYQDIKIIDATAGSATGATVTSVGLKVDVGTGSIVNTTITVQNIQNALPAGSSSLGNVNINSTGTLTVSGSLSVTSLSTATINTPTPQVANYNGYVSPSGTVQSAAVTLSSQAIVYVANPSTVTFNGVTQPVVIVGTPPVTVSGSTIAVSGVQGIIQTVITSTPPIQVFGTTIAVTNVSGQNLNVAGSLSVVSLSTGQINTPVPQVTTYNGFISPTNTIQAAAVTLSSQTIVYVANPATVTVTGTVPVVLTSTPPIQVFGSTIAISGIQGIVQTVITSTPPIQVFGSTIAVSGVQGIVQTSLTSTPTVTVILSTITAVGMYADNGVSSATDRVNVNAGVYQNGTSAMAAGSQGKNGAPTVGTDHMTWVTPQPAIVPPSYTASTNTFSIASSTQDAFALCGNSSHIVEVMGIRASCTQTTAGIIQIGIVKRSSGYSGVWSTAPIVSESSNYGGSKSTATFFTSANLVVGSLVGYLDAYKLGCLAPGTASPNDLYVSPADWRIKPIVLNSATECVAINMNGATVSGGTMSATFDFEEINVSGYNPQ
jgi:hypothetical protein